VRIRSVKPDFFRDEITGHMDPSAALFYVGLSCYADDEGRFEWIAALIRADLDPFDAKWGGVVGIEKQLEGLASLGRVIRYTVNARHYGVIPTQKRHQKPNRPSPSRFPPPPEGLTEDSVSEQGALTAGVGEGVGEGEGAGALQGVRRARPARLGLGSPQSEAALHWQGQVWPKMSPAACPPITERDAASLRSLCERYSVADVMAAMDRAAADPFWADKLDLPTFVAKFPRFLERRPADAKKGGRGPVAVPTDWTKGLEDIA
jgi:hypothetical protein